MRLSIDSSPRRITDSSQSAVMGHNIFFTNCSSPETTCLCGRQVHHGVPLSCSAIAPRDTQTGCETGDTPCATRLVGRGKVQPKFLGPKKRWLPQAHPGPSANEHIFNDHTVQNEPIIQCAPGRLDGYSRPERCTLPYFIEPMTQEVPGLCL